MIKAPLPAAKSNRGLFGGTNSAVVAVEGTPKSKKLPLKLGEIDLNRPLIDGNNNKSKNKDKGSTDKDNDNDSNHGSVVVTPEPKSATTSKIKQQHLRIQQVMKKMIILITKINTLKKNIKMMMLLLQHRNQKENIHNSVIFLIVLPAWRIQIS